MRERESIMPFYRRRLHQRRHSNARPSLPPLNPSAPTRVGAPLENAENAQEEVVSPLPIWNDAFDDATDPKDDATHDATDGDEDECTGGHRCCCRR